MECDICLHREICKHEKAHREASLEGGWSSANWAKAQGACRYYFGGENGCDEEIKVGGTDCDDD